MKIQILRRWVVVAVGLALLCGLPVIASALPVRVPGLTASQLRGRILASADESYAGYAESNATFGLPPLAGLTGLISLLDDVTKMRVWQATPTRWRVDVLSDAGERPAGVRVDRGLRRRAGHVRRPRGAPLGRAEPGRGHAVGGRHGTRRRGRIGGADQATVVQPYLPTRYWLAWIDFFRQPVFWRDIQRGFGIQVVYVVVFLAAA